MLRVAVPNKGSLAEPAASMLRESGYRQRHDTRDLVLQDPDNDTEFFFLRPRDIAIYVGSGQLDVGITGRDLLLDSGAAAEEILQLGFAQSTFRFAARPGSAATVVDFAGKRVATSYSGLLAKYFADRGVDAERDPPRRCGRDRGAARGRRCDRRRRRDRVDAATGRPRDRGRADPGVRGSPRTPCRRARTGRRSTSWSGACKASSSPGAMSSWTTT